MNRAAANARLMPVPALFTAAVFLFSHLQTESSLPPPAGKFLTEFQKLRTPSGGLVTKYLTRWRLAVQKNVRLTIEFV